jgi:hypothetical protein
MVAGDTKKIIVIKNISSNLIEEAIIILRNEPGGQENNQLDKPASDRLNVKNDFILKEAESIINRYIRENGLIISQNRHCRRIRKIPRISLSVNAIINILLVVAAAFLIFVVGKLI